MNPATASALGLVFAAALRAQSSMYQSITEERLREAYEDARAACAEVLKIELVPPELVIVSGVELADVVTAENLPLVKLREPDPERADEQAKAIGQQFRFGTFAKYSWSRGQVLVPRREWSLAARTFKIPELTHDAALRAVLVHELCHALDDRKFGFAKTLQTATTSDAVVAMNAVIEGHAQVMTRRICGQSGLEAGFAALTKAVGVVPEFALLGEATMETVRREVQRNASAYHDGERFVAAVLSARPETGSRELYESPPRDPHTIMRPEWYLNPATRPKLRFEVAPLFSLFEARFDRDTWGGERVSLTPEDVVQGLSGVAESERAVAAAGIRNARSVRLDARSGDMVSLVATEFVDDAAADRFLAHARSSYRYREEAMESGVLAYRSITCTDLRRPRWRGLLANIELLSGAVRIDAVCLHAERDGLMLELFFHGKPPARDDLVELADRLFEAVVRR